MGSSPWWVARAATLTACQHCPQLGRKDPCDCAVIGWPLPEPVTDAQRVAWAKRCADARGR
jgi:hypothetical protein